MQLIKCTVVYRIIALFKYITFLSIAILDNTFQHFNIFYFDRLIQFQTEFEAEAEALL